MMGFGFVFIIIFWGVIIIGAIWIGRYLLNSNSNFSNFFSTNTSSDVEDILKRRYAEGELTKEEYEQMRTDLE